MISLACLKLSGLPGAGVLVCRTMIFALLAPFAKFSESFARIAPDSLPYGMFFELGACRPFANPPTMSLACLKLSGLPGAGVLTCRTTIFALFPALARPCASWLKTAPDSGPKGMPLPVGLWRPLAICPIISLACLKLSGDPGAGVAIWRDSSPLYCYQYIWRRNVLGVRIYPAGAALARPIARRIAAKDFMMMSEL
jgi:hypothetical protein